MCAITTWYLNKDLNRGKESLMPGESKSFKDITENKGARPI